MRAGIKTIILPKKNEKDLEEIPEHIRNQMTFKFVQRMDEAIELALRKDLRPPIPRGNPKALEKGFRQVPKWPNLIRVRSQQSTSEIGSLVNVET